jgi:hypothetical protein
LAKLFLTELAVLAGGQVEWGGFCASLSRSLILRDINMLLFCLGIFEAAFQLVDNLETPLRGVS